jgi:hypothetical protein
MSEFFHPIIEHPDLPYYRAPPWLKYQAFKFLLENPSTTCVPSNTGDSSNSLKPVEEKLSGHKRKRKYYNKPVLHLKSHRYCHSCDTLGKVIKIEDPRGNFW